MRKVSHHLRRGGTKLALCLKGMLVSMPWLAHSSHAWALPLSAARGARQMFTGLLIQQFSLIGPSKIALKNTVRQARSLIDPPGNPSAVLDRGRYYGHLQLG